MKALLLFCLAWPLCAQAPKLSPKLRVGILGLTHGHAAGFLRNALTRTDLDIVGISEPNAEVAERYRQRHQLDRARLFRSHSDMIDQAKPEVVMVFTSTFEHLEAVQICAQRKLHVMMEKPLAVSVEHARAMDKLSKEAGIHVMVNYETTWYPVNAPIWSLVHNEGKLGGIRRLVTHYGHQGPKEIGTPPEFFNWLTDPAQNGAGALFDFGCYGANFATWLFGNARPLTVSAVTRTNKPAIYPWVDDEATVTLQYPTAQVIIQPSWNWPFSRKDMEIYGETGSLITSNPSDYRLRLRGEKQDTALTAAPLPDADRDVIRYLTSVVRQGRQPDGLTGLANNLIVTEILAAARESARTGRVVKLQ